MEFPYLNPQALEWYGQLSMMTQILPTPGQRPVIRRHNIVATSERRRGSHTARCSPQLHTTWEPGHFNGPDFFPLQSFLPRLAGQAQHESEGRDMMRDRSVRGLGRVSGPLSRHSGSWHQLRSPALSREKIVVSDVSRIPSLTQSQITAEHRLLRNETRSNTCKIYSLLPPPLLRLSSWLIKIIERVPVTQGAVSVIIPLARDPVIRQVTGAELETSELKHPVHPNTPAGPGSSQFCKSGICWWRGPVSGWWRVAQAGCVLISTHASPQK